MINCDIKKCNCITNNNFVNLFSVRLDRVENGVDDEEDGDEEEEEEEEEEEDDE